MARFSDDLKSAISQLSQDIVVELNNECCHDRRAIAILTIDMLDLRYPESSQELNGLVASTSYEEVIAEAMEYVATCRSRD
jgi:hypothetical protein